MSVVDLHTDLDDGLYVGNVLKPHPNSKYATMYERIMANTHEPENDLGCWYWKGRVNSRNYPVMNLRANGEHKTVLVHRLLAKIACDYDMWHALFGGDVEPDHTCYNRTCLNPEHIQVLPRVLNQKCKTNS